MANRKRIPFHPDGPFVARKSFMLGGKEMVMGKRFTAARIADLGPRRAEQLFEANYFDMAPPKGHHPVEQPEIAAEPATGAEGGQGTGDGGQEAAEGLNGPENGSGGETVTAAEDSEGSEGAEEGAALGGEAAPSAATDPTIAAYKNFGFGKFYPINAAGEKLLDKPMGKASAEGLASASKVPLLGQNESLGGDAAE